MEDESDTAQPICWLRTAESEPHCREGAEPM